MWARLVGPMRRGVSRLITRAQHAWLIRQSAARMVAASGSPQRFTPLAAQVQPVQRLLQVHSLLYCKQTLQQ